MLVCDCVANRWIGYSWTYESDDVKKKTQEDSSRLNSSSNQFVRTMWTFCWGYMLEYVGTLV